jgi:hypothetical protein
MLQEVVPSYKNLSPSNNEFIIYQKRAFQQYLPEADDLVGSRQVIAMAIVTEVG